jgi:hypothetical protein
MGSNIKFEIINVDQQKDHAATKYFETISINSFPAAVLLSPDGQSLAINISKTDQPFKKTLKSALDGILMSPKREEIVGKVIQSYAVLLLIEGKRAKENESAYKAASAAIERIDRNLDLFPKPIENPPVLVVLNATSIPREKILLWSLGLNTDVIAKPHAVVLYGRARWIGPLFKGEEITRDYLSEILFIVGADCECGLDREWLQGTMLPLRWDKKMQAHAVKNLGFDPENPLIKMEVNHIMRMGSFYSGADVATRDRMTNSDSARQDSIAANETSSLMTSLYFTLFFMFILLTGGAIFVWHRTRRRR